MQQCDVTPIVLVRNIHGSLVILNDEIVKIIEEKIPPLTTMIHIPSEFISWDIDKRIDFLVTIYAPWLAFFLIRWADLSRWAGLNGEKH